MRPQFNINMILILNYIYIHKKMKRMQCFSHRRIPGRSPNTWTLLRNQNLWNTLRSKLHLHHGGGTSQHTIDQNHRHQPVFFCRPNCQHLPCVSLSPIYCIPPSIYPSIHHSIHQSQNRWPFRTPCQDWRPPPAPAIPLPLLAFLRPPPPRTSHHTQIHSHIQRHLHHMDWSLLSNLFQWNAIYPPGKIQVIWPISF